VTVDVDGQADGVVPELVADAGQGLALLNQKAGEAVPELVEVPVAQTGAEKQGAPHVPHQPRIALREPLPQLGCHEPTAAAARALRNQPGL
jgi:hypothetical protein